MVNATRRGASLGPLSNSSEETRTTMYFLCWTVSVAPSSDKANGRHNPASGGTPAHKSAAMSDSEATFRD